ncbi:hypothetical protein [Streptomyces sp. WMMB303]|uniref:hypothetical protein n=1 Tax=Streptomyces sp. WMMB303 TaxID=3034154 RepID=UPI0023EB2C6E|nr:hypothetical protein [Streptomyces sp. WMMB303]MDF4250320.1 hypothetical protein [Streptomyces sp. WMMB303]
MGRWRIPGGGLTVAVVIAAVLASCSGLGEDGGGRDDGGGDNRGDGRGERSASAPLSVAAVGRMAAEPGSRCPVPYDVAAAARAAGVHGGVEDGSVEGELPDGADSPLAQSDGALVDCGYRLGEEQVRLFTVGVAKGYAVSVLLPQIQHDAGIPMDDLLDYAGRAQRAKRGEALLASSGNVAAVRLPVTGEGDVALVLSIGEHRTRLSEEQVTELATRLAGQARGRAPDRGPAVDRHR